MMIDPPPPFGHARADGLGCEKLVVEIERQGPSPGLRFKITHRVTIVLAGVVDQNINAAARLFDLGNGPT
ncbi:hypothetical protein ACVIRM_005501 [Rhizobium laguerreae]